jgi:hypothetical protein
MVYMVIYQGQDGLWVLWEAPLARNDIPWSAQMCRSAVGDGPEIRWVAGATTDALAAFIIKANEDQSILNSTSTVVQPWTGPGLLPDPRPYWSLDPADRRRLDLENGPGGDHDTNAVYERTDADRTAWASLLARYQRGELES